MRRFLILVTVVTIGLAVAASAEAKGGHGSSGSKGSKGSGSGSHPTPVVKLNTIHPGTSGNHHNHHFTYRRWLSGYGCYCYWDSSCWWYWSDVDSCYHPYSDITDVAPAVEPEGPANADTGAQPVDGQ